MLANDATTGATIQHAGQNYHLSHRCLCGETVRAVKAYLEMCKRRDAAQIVAACTTAEAAAAVAARLFTTLTCNDSEIYFNLTDPNVQDIVLQHGIQQIRGQSGAPDVARAIVNDHKPDELACLIVDASGDVAAKNYNRRLELLFPMIPPVPGNGQPDTPENQSPGTLPQVHSDSPTSDWEARGISTGPLDTRSSSPPDSTPQNHPEPGQTT